MEWDNLKHYRNQQTKQQKTTQSSKSTTIQKKNQITNRNQQKSQPKQGANTSFIGKRVYCSWNESNKNLHYDRNLRKEQSDELILLEWIKPYPLYICRQSCLWWMEHMMRRWIHHFWFRLQFELKRYEKEILQNCSHVKWWELRFGFGSNSRR